MLHRLRRSARPVLAGVALSFVAALPAAAIQPIPGIQVPMKDQVKTDQPECQGVQMALKQLRKLGFLRAAYQGSEGYIMVFLANRKGHGPKLLFKVRYDPCLKQVISVQGQD